ncbi:hypothetical protein RZS08_40430, partial [Arthrospira platensis SPKY1]|nr:hypothetical protein [Arthrospira platensis SPKY1]
MHPISRKLNALGTGVQRTTFLTHQHQEKLQAKPGLLANLSGMTAHGTQNPMGKGLQKRNIA